MNQPPKRTAGRPPVYTSEKPKQLIELMAKGMLNCEIFAHWGISKDTFYRWLREHDDFKEAYDIGFAKCESYFVNEMKKMLSGEQQGKHSFNACIALLNNKFGWSKNASAEGTQTQININQINILQNKNKDELLEYIKDQIIDQELIDLDPTQYEVKKP